MRAPSQFGGPLCFCIVGCPRSSALASFRRVARHEFGSDSGDSLVACARRGTRPRGTSFSWGYFALACDLHNALAGRSDQFAAFWCSSRVIAWPAYRISDCLWCGVGMVAYPFPEPGSLHGAASRDQRGREPWTHTMSMLLEVGYGSRGAVLERSRRYTYRSTCKRFR